MNPTVRALKQQILRTHPDNLRKVIKDKFAVDREGLFNVEQLTDALAAAVRERPSIADVICPWLTKSNDYSLAEILMEVLPALWPARTELLLKTLHDVVHSKNKDIRLLVENTISVYKNPDEDFESGFRLLLIEEGY